MQKLNMKSLGKNALVTHNKVIRSHLELRMDREEIIFMVDLIIEAENRIPAVFYFVQTMQGMWKKLRLNF